jgi:hypothetical protein
MAIVNSLIVNLAKKIVPPYNRAMATLPPGIRPGTKEWGAAARTIRASRFAARIRTKASVPADAFPLPDVAAALGISPFTLRSRISRGTLKAYYVGTRPHIRPVDAAQRPPRSQAKIESDLRNLQIARRHQQQPQTSPQGKIGSELASDVSLYDGPQCAQDAAGRIEEAKEDSEHGDEERSA